MLSLSEDFFVQVVVSYRDDELDVAHLRLAQLNFYEIVIGVDNEFAS